MNGLWLNYQPRISRAGKASSQAKGSAVSAFEHDLGNFELAICVDAEIEYFGVDNNSH